MPTTINDDNGSLYTGDRVEVGAFVLIEGETKPRRVTYAMGSAKRGWRACFRGQGAVPVGEVAWRIVEDATFDADESTKRTGAIIKQSLASPRTSAAIEWPTSALPPDANPDAHFAGFDSAWTRTNRGAIAGISLFADRCLFVAPVTANFDEALDLLESPGRLAPLCVVAIDQPLVVPNLTSSRPVDRSVSCTISRLKGGMQPANRSRSDMFGDDAPIWSFLSRIGASLDPLAALGAKTGRFAFETYPVLATSGLIPQFYDRGRQAKYNPTRPAFSLEDWRSLCLGLADCFEAQQVEGGAEWCRFAALLEIPRKADQDKLDAVICALCALLWWRRGLERSVVVGDMLNGYIVAPAHDMLARELERNARRLDVPFTSSLNRITAI